jgi:hypothetical protein
LGGWSVTLLAVLAQELRSHLVEQFLQGLAVVEGLLQLRDQLWRHMHTTAAAFVRERKNESRMFVAAGAGRAVGADAGFADLSQGAFDGGPELLESAKKVLMENEIRRFGTLHGSMYIIQYTCCKREKSKSFQVRFPAVTEALHLRRKSTCRSGRDELIYSPFWCQVSSVGRAMLS